MQNTHPPVPRAPRRSRKARGADTRDRAAALHAEIEDSRFAIVDVATETPHDDGGTYNDTPARYGYVLQVLTGDRTSGPMVEKLEAAFGRLTAGEASRT